MDQKFESLENRVISLEKVVIDIKSDLKIVQQCATETQTELASIKSDESTDPNFQADSELDTEEKIMTCEDMFGTNKWYRKNMVNI